MDKNNILEVKDLSIEYRLKDRVIKAVRNLDLNLRRGDIHGIVGESGSGKSTIALSFLKLITNPGVITNGEITYYGYDGPGRDILKMKPSELNRLRWKEISMVFQSSMNSLNPVMRIEDQLSDVMIEHGYSVSEINNKIDDVLRISGLPTSVRKQYPHELSGGMKQRVNIALALTCDPKILIADEATTALDVVVQRQILTRLIGIQETLNLSIVFITHDISLIANIANRVSVVYAGKVVESASSQEIFSNPKHPYTIALINSIPKLEREKHISGIPGSPPDMSKPIKGCPFAERCPKAFDKCYEKEPDLIHIGSEHLVSCHLYGM